MPRRLHQTMADYVVLAISPALIMALVGSLVFFLLAVLYQGEFAGRLHWVMACFVFASVLIGRISIEQGFERAAPFGIALAIVVGIAASRFMAVQGTWIDSFAWLINWGLIALIWWCAHRLTWDCTLIDDQQDSSGEGLLQTAGLERPAAGTDAQAPDKRLEGTTARQVPAGWWQRDARAERLAHAPGVWVVYFSLAALPLFGIGQWFIPVENVSGRRYAFWLLSVYVASGMGLLLTTSFLGLRRYLRQRRIEMPTLMANLWLATGTVVIVVLLLLAALLPRPSAEYAVSRLPFALGSPKAQASRQAPVKREGTRDQEPGPAADTKPDDQRESTSPEPNAGDRQQSTGSQGQSPDRQTSESRNSQGETKQDNAPRRESSDAQGESQRSRSTAGQGQSDKQPDKSPADSQGSDEGKTPPPDDPQSRLEKAVEKGKQERSRASSPPDAAEPQRQQQQTEDERPQESKPAEAAEQPPKSDEPPQAPEVALPSVGAAELFKWVFYAVVVVAVAYAAWRSRAELASMVREFLSALRNLFSGFWPGGPRRTVAAEGQLPIEFPPTPFASYADPFDSALASRSSTEELIRYSFEAFEAWAREHGCARRADQTPHELVRDVSNLNAFIAAEARNVADLYARAAYAHGELPPSAREQLQQLWRRMRASAVLTP